MNQLFSFNQRLWTPLALSLVTILHWPAVARSATPAASLQSLVNDTAAQIQLAYRQHPAERDGRQQQLAAVVATWRASARSETNSTRLAAWLRAAIASSMPGSRDPLPSPPIFVAMAAEPVQASGSVIVKKASSVPDATADADPFKDDPATERE